MYSQNVENPRKQPTPISIPFQFKVITLHDIAFPMALQQNGVAERKSKIAQKLHERLPAEKTPQKFGLKR